MKRVFLIVLDSVGIGAMPDAAEYNDAGSNTLGTVSKSADFRIPNLLKLGLGQIDGITLFGYQQMDSTETIGSYARMTEASKGKDTTIGHWEIAGIISEKPLPTYPKGFPKEVLDEFSKRTGRGILCNLPYSGTDVIRDYGQRHMETGDLIVYTSADSVFQIAAHEEIVPVEQLYEYCEIAREILTGAHGVGRVIARPFIGENGNFVRTANRHDYSLKPPKPTMLDYLQSEGHSVLGVGKIYDIFAGKGLTEYVRSSNNADGIEKLLDYMAKDFKGLCFVNLVDYDMLYGHRNDIDGYARALTYFDEQLPRILSSMREEDMLIITADHGCDPGTASTDHSREYTPLLLYGSMVPAGINFGTRNTFADIGATILDFLGVESYISGTSMWRDMFWRNSILKAKRFLDKKTEYQ